MAERYRVKITDVDGVRLENEINAQDDEGYDLLTMHSAYRVNCMVLTFEKRKAQAGRKPKDAKVEEPGEGE